MSRPKRLVNYEIKRKDDKEKEKKPTVRLSFGHAKILYRTVTLLMTHNICSVPYYISLSTIT